jgi:MFS family permease
MHMRNVTSLYHVYDLSGSSLQLGLTGFFQAFPFVCFGLLGGVLADTFNRKKMIISTQLLNVVPGAILGILTATGAIQVWHIYVLNLVTASLQVMGSPARQAIVPNLVPPSHLMNAITLTTLMQQGTQLTGPVLAGYLIDFVGVDKSYFIDAALLLPSMVAVLMIKSRGQAQGMRRKITLRSLIEGFEFLWQQRIILSLFLLDFFAVLVGFYRPILPIFASDVFKVGAGGLGALYAAPAIGALAGSGLVLVAGNVERKGAAAVIGAFIFALSLGLLGLSQWFWSLRRRSAWVQRRHWRRHSPNGRTIPRAGQHARTGLEFSDDLCSRHKRSWRRYRRSGSGAGRSVQCASARLCPLCRHYFGDLLGDPAALGVSVAVKSRPGFGCQVSGSGGRALKPET